MHAFSRRPATLRGVTTSDTNIAVFGHTRGCDPPHDARLRQDLHRASRRGSERGGERASEQEKEGEGKCVCERERERYRGTSPIRKHPSPYDPPMTLGITVLLWGPKGLRFLKSEVLLYT